MKFLFLCNKSPWPSSEGGPIAMNALISGLAEAGHSIHVVAVSSNKFKGNPKAIPENIRHAITFEDVFIDLSIKPLPAFLNLFSQDSYHVQRFISRNMQNRLSEILKTETFDLIQLETIYMAPYLHCIRAHSSAPVVLRAHNIEHLIWKRVADSSRNPVKKFYLNHLARTLENYEMRIVNEFNGIATITSRDANFFRDHDCNVPMTDITFGVNQQWLDRCKGEKAPKELSFFHIGSMDWIPNQEGLKWFLEEVWDDFASKNPGIKFYLAGRNMPEWLLHRKQKGLEVVGEVDDAMDFICSHSAMIVPLLSGSGIRIKIIEALACSRAVITTEIGAEGIQYTHGENILIANTPEEFLSAMQQCVDKKGYTQDLGLNGRKLIEEEHFGERIIDRLIKFYHQL